MTRTVLCMSTPADNRSVVVRHLRRRDLDETRTYENEADLLSRSTSSFTEVNKPSMETLMEDRLQTKERDRTAADRHARGIAGRLWVRCLQDQAPDTWDRRGDALADACHVLARRVSVSIERQHWAGVEAMGMALVLLAARLRRLDAAQSERLTFSERA